MADQSGSARFRASFESALQTYQKKTGVPFAQHPLAAKLLSCHTVEDITTLLQTQAETFSDSPAGDRIIELIKTTVSILTPFSDAASFDDAVGLVRRQKALMACFASLTVSCRESHT